MVRFWLILFFIVGVWYGDERGMKGRVWGGGMGKRERE